MNFINSHQVCLEMSQTPPPLASAYATAGAQQRAQINQHCLAAFLPWLQSEFNLVAKVSPNTAALPSIWEVVNGTALTVANKRLVLIPSVAIDLTELCVPQEWVDISTWAADYYVAMQVDPEEHLIKIAGYTTHQRLKAAGVDRTIAGNTPVAWNRTYCMDIDDLLQDINSLWLSLQLYPQAEVRAAVAPIPLLPQAQADRLLERLGNPAVLFPRLAIPFDQWAALLAHGGWRQRLYERRQGWSDAGSVPQWIQSRLSGFARQCGWERRDFFLARVRSVTTGVRRTLTIAGRAYDLWVFPARRSSALPEEAVLQHLWRVELRSAVSDGLVPAGFKLRLLTEDLQAMANNEDIATTAVDALCINVALVSGEGVVWEVEPTPEDFEREILRF